jgi:uncharacterized protein (TIGR00661 family)
MKEFRFEVFSKKAKSIEVNNNITFIPVNNEMFNNSMLHSEGIITGAGFETPAEALYLGKKLLCLPIQGQYEQLCNAAALQQFNVPIIENIDSHFTAHIYNWLQMEAPKKLQLNQSTLQTIEHVITKGLELKKQPTNTISKINLKQEEIFTLQPHPQFG